MTRRLPVLMMLLLAALLLAPAAGQAQTITDLAGRAVEAPANPQRVVALGPGALRLVCYLQAQDRVVGIEDFERKRPQGRPYWYANPGLTKLPTVSAGGPGMINKLPDLERVLAVKPDIIFVTNMERGRADELQARLGVPVVAVSYGRFAGFDHTVFKSLALMGQVLGKEQRAQAVADLISQAQEDLARRVKDVDTKTRPTVYVGGIGFKGFQGITSTDPTYVPTQWVGADNVAKETGKGGHTFVGKEQVLAWNPEVVFIDATGLNLVAEDYAKKPAFYQGLQAFKQGRVYVLHPFVYYVTNLGTAVVSAYAAGKVLYPERFKDVDLAAKAKEVYGFLVGGPVYGPMQKFFGSLGAQPAFLR